MDVQLARTFLAIARSGSFMHAAAALNLTQTAVSARIRVLEQQLERSLFVRNQAGARLTPAGEQFLPHATTMVQTWERARRAVALPAGRHTAISIGAQLSLWNPFLHECLLWLRRECPDVAVSAQIDAPARLVEQVQAGLIDVAIVYAAPRQPGIVAELLFEETLVLVRTGHAEALAPEQQVGIDWGEDFAASFKAAFPDRPRPVFEIGYGPLALQHILAVGGSGYFRKGFVQPLLDDGTLTLVPDSPEFSYSAYAVHNSKADETMIARIRPGLRAASRPRAPSAP